MSSAPHPPEFFDLVQQGDRRATADFVDRYAPVALAYLGAKFTRISEAEHEEVVQEVLVDVIASLPRYDRTRSFKAWFLTITSRRALDFMKRHSDEWMKGDFGQIPTHVSYEEATGPDGPEELKTQVRMATAMDSGPDVALQSEEGDVAEPVLAGSLATQLDALRRWTESLTPEQGVLLSHYTLGASWEDVAEQLTRLGEAVKPATARVRGHRLIDSAKKKFEVERGDP